MFQGLVRTFVKVLMASLVVGAIMSHFGITPETFMKGVGVSQERLAELAQSAINWALPNLLLGSFVIVPVWLVTYLLRPPRVHNE